MTDTEKTIELKIPVTLHYDEETEAFYVYPNKDTEKILGPHHIGVHGSGKTIQEAEEKFWMLFRWIQEITFEDHQQLPLWKPLQCGPWKHFGGRWFTTFGIQVYFRTATKKSKDTMVGGWFVPFTNLNINITNLWKVRKNILKKSL